MGITSSISKSGYMDSETYIVWITLVQQTEPRKKNGYLYNKLQNTLRILILVVKVVNRLWFGICNYKYGVWTSS